MNKLNFLLSLQDRLSFLPQEDLEERLVFYDEMIVDRMEEGLSEEEAVAQIGSVDEIASQILADTPLSALVQKKIKHKKRMNTWTILLLCIGSPLWLSLLISAFAVVFSVYAVLWAVVISLWAVFTSVAVCAPAGILAGVIFCCEGHTVAGIVMFAAALVCAGIAIFLFFSCKAVTRGSVWLTGQILLAIKRCFIKKEEA